MSLLVITVLLVEYVVIPQLLGARHDLRLLASGQPWLLGAALGLEAVSLLGYSALSRVALDPRGRPSYAKILRIDVTGLGASHVLPGGGAAAVALRLRLLSDAGVRTRDAATSMAIQTVASILMLAGLFVLGLAMSVPQMSGHPGFDVAGAAAVLVLVGAVLLVGSLVRMTEQTLRVLRSVVLRVPLMRAPAALRVLDDAANHLRTLAADPPMLRRTGVFAFANWALDAAALWLCLAAYGYDAAVGPLLAVYAAANLVALLPITPGGLGIVEGLLVPLLISFGADPPVALLGVLTWRLMEYWLPIPVAAVAFASLQLERLMLRENGGQEPRPSTPPLGPPADPRDTVHDTAPARPDRSTGAPRPVGRPGGHAPGADQTRRGPR